MKFPEKLGELTNLKKRPRLQWTKLPSEEKKLSEKAAGRCGSPTMTIHTEYSYTEFHFCYFYCILLDKSCISIQLDLISGIKE